MLAVNRDPILGDHAGGQPEPQTKEVADGRMKIERAMRLHTMQIDCYRGYGDVGDDQRIERSFHHTRSRSPCASTPKSVSMMCLNFLGRKYERNLMLSGVPQRRAPAGRNVTVHLILRIMGK